MGEKVSPIIGGGNNGAAWFYQSGGMPRGNPPPWSDELAELVVADGVAIIGSVDISLGDVDR